MGLEDLIAANRFLGYERQAVMRLRVRLPQSESTEDLFADVRVMALDAASKFDASKGARFETFLYRHLQMKGMEMVRNYWRERRAPPEVSTITPDQTPSQDCPAAQAEFCELFTKVPDPTRNILRMCLATNTTELRSAFGLRTWRFKVGTLLGVPTDSVAAAVAELRREIPKHISSVETR